MNKKHYDLPKYQKIRSFLLEQLSIGKFEKGNKFYSEMKIAEMLKVSHLTARKALSGLEEEGYLAREAGAGTFVIRIPEKPCRPRIVETCNIGVLSGEAAIESTAVGKVLSGIHKAASDRGYMIYLAHKAVDTMLKAQVEGIIAFGIFSNKDIEKLKESGIPTVMMGPYEGKGVNFLMADYFSTGYNVAQYFTELNHENITLVGSSADSYVIHKALLKGIHKAFDDSGKNIKKINAFPREKDFSSLDKLLSSAQRPTALLLLDWDSVMPVFQLLNKKGLKIPEDISVMAYGDTALSMNTVPNLTAVRVFSEEGGKMAVELLCDVIKNPNLEPRGILRKTKIIEKDSCKIKSNKE